MSTHTVMTTENRDQREEQSEPKSAGESGGGTVLGVTPCSPFDLLMGQIEGMKNRANKYRKDAQEEGDMEEAGQQMRAYMCLKELHRLGRYFEANEERTPTQ